MKIEFEIEFTVINAIAVFAALSALAAIAAVAAIASISAITAIAAIASTVSIFSFVLSERTSGVSQVIFNNCVVNIIVTICNHPP